MQAKWSHLRAEWRVLSYYQRFEGAVALVLTLVIGAVVLVALYRLVTNVFATLIVGADPLDYKVFQAIFGEILTLLIALEFNHTLQYVVTRQQSIIQTKVVLLIALLALARKFIIIDLDQVTIDLLLGLAAVTLALAISYWLVREREERQQRDAGLVGTER